MTAITRSDAPRRTSPPTPGVLFEGTSWDDYEAMLRIVGDRPIRVTYDRGSMELMAPLWKHGGVSYLLGRIIDVLTEEWDIPVEAADPVTFKREDLAKGVEPDKCYYFGDHAAQVRGKDRLTMGVDPPPDLVIEADITASSLDRLGIYAALGIREVWRFADQSLQFLHLQGDRSFQARATSLHFPGLPLALIFQALVQAEGSDKTAWVRSFRADVRALPPPPPRDHLEG
ncbi:Endonuclease, Uma2 family (restriction endonuclease fold) [Singulisphaera sp. GP187]|uniref:Uma2 family endonuclease n=1 Tax=Singulisphaera sp. GP187 TaxID=1882752 RepID=UPI0009262A78|nr:Uma2 family endonuclease [Singulisphaera sp. GP187]SIO32935.1 Endonuclease, Uma2 family (restriction endonuclease fold) [Singulisphaera sp. GP187]